MASSDADSQLIAAYTAYFMGMEGVISVELGKDAMGNRVIRVRVTREAYGVLPIPDTFQGIPVEVRVGRIPGLLHAPHIAKVRPLQAGVSCRPLGLSGSGTLGGLVSSGGKTFAVSNNHVLADNDPTNIGSVLLQPSESDGGIGDDQVGIVRYYDPFEFNAVNLRDIAVAEITLPEPVSFVPLDFTDPPSGIYREPGIGETARKSGRTTGLTLGSVDGVNVTSQVGYGPFGPPFITFSRLIRVTPGSFSEPGDSGSWVYDQQMNMIGMLFAGDGETTLLINPLEVKGYLDQVLAPPALIAQRLFPGVFTILPPPAPLLVVAGPFTYNPPLAAGSLTMEEGQALTVSVPVRNDGNLAGTAQMFLVDQPALVFNQPGAAASINPGETLTLQVSVVVGPGTFPVGTYPMVAGLNDVSGPVPVLIGSAFWTLVVNALPPPAWQARDLTLDSITPVPTFVNPGETVTLTVAVGNPLLKSLPANATFTMIAPSGARALPFAAPFVPPAGLSSFNLQVTSAPIPSGLETGFYDVEVVLTDGVTIVSRVFTDVVSILAPPVTITDLVLTPDPVVVEAGQSVQVTLTALMSDGSQNANFVGQVFWTSENLSIFAVSAGGLVTGIVAGTDILTATHPSGFSKQFGVTVTPPGVLEAVGEPTFGPLALTVGESLGGSWVAQNNRPTDAFVAIQLDLGAQSQLSPNSLVPVGTSFGFGISIIVTQPAGAYTATLRLRELDAAGAILGDIARRDYTVTVNAPPATVTDVILTLAPGGPPFDPVEVQVGQSLQLFATAFVSDGGQNTNFVGQATWSSSNSGVFTFSPTGLLTGVAVGSGLLTVVTTDGFLKNFNVNVTGGPPPPAQLTKDEIMTEARLRGAGAGAGADTRFFVGGTLADFNNDGLDTDSVINPADAQVAAAGGPLGYVNSLPGETGRTWNDISFTGLPVVGESAWEYWVNSGLLLYIPRGFHDDDSVFLSANPAQTGTVFEKRAGDTYLVVWDDFNLGSTVEAEADLLEYQPF